MYINMSLKNSMEHPKKLRDQIKVSHPQEQNHSSDIKECIYKQRENKGAEEDTIRIIIWN